MTDPERLIQGGDDLAQAILRAGAEDGPSDLSRQKVAAALGIGAAAPAASSSSTPRLLKWLGGVTIGLALLGAAAYFLQTRNTPALDSNTPSHAPASTETVATPAPENAPTPTESASIAAPIQVAEPPVVDAPQKSARTPPPAASAPLKTKKRPSTLDAEMALLDAARASLRAGNPGAALRTLDDYNAQFPRGLLSPEATVVRIEALVKSGNKAGARKLGEIFLRAYPSSPLADRVRSLTNL